MPQILMKFQDDTNSVNEWAIVELQGDLETQNGESLRGKFIGHLIYTIKGVPVLTIGHHILHGKVVDVSPPLAVLRRHRIEEDSENSNTTSRTEYNLVTLITKKILFKSRPKPIVPTSLTKK